MGDTAPVAVVTGASRGAGQGIAAALAGRGWRVYGTGRSIPENPQWGTGVQVDHRDDDAVGQFFDQVAAECGGLDLLVNNAAVISEELVQPNRSGRSPASWPTCWTWACGRPMSRRGMPRRCCSNASGD